MASAWRRPRRRGAGRRARRRPGSAGPGGAGRAAERAGAGESRQAAPEGAVRSDRQLVHRRRRARRRLAVRPHARGAAEADAGRAEALRRLRGGGEGRQGLSRRHRQVLAGRHAGDHDARLADRHDSAADGDLHDQRVHEQLPRRSISMAASTPTPTSSSARSTASRSAAGKATRWSSTRGTSPTSTSTGSIRAFRRARTSA